MTTTINHNNAEEIKQTLLSWASQGTLANAVLSEDGSTLSAGSTLLSATEPLTIRLDEPGSSNAASAKSCTYSTAAIFLQIKDPDQSLMKYRTACKQYHVTDMVKAIDKATVVAFFLGSAAHSNKSAATAVTEEGEELEDSHHRGATTDGSRGDADAAKATVEENARLPEHERHAEDDNYKETAATSKDEEREQRKDKKRSSSKHHHRDKEHRSSKKDRKHGSSSKDKSSRHRTGGASSDEKLPKKKQKEEISNETLFSNLNVVVDKRTKNSTNLPERTTQEEITKALSTDGFQVTPELLEEYRETTETILANEIPVGNSASILRAVNPQKNLSRVLELFLETVSSSSSGNKAARSSKTPVPPVKPVKLHLLGKKPVILVPKGMTAPITLINAHEFLCNGRFVDRNVMIKQGRHRNPPTTFTRNVRGSLTTASAAAAGTTSSLLEYEILDNPKKLGSDLKEWDRIVAVIVLGQSWQFKDWPTPYNDPVHLFERTFGFFISMEGDKLPAEIQGWAVKQARLNRDKRGMDSVTFASFWNGLDEYMNVHKRELLPQTEV